MSLAGFDFLGTVFPTFCDDDISDRLHHRWTVVLLAVFAMMTTFDMYVGDPIHCWCPAQFTDSHCNYTESYCWVKDTYYIPPDEYIPNKVEDRDGTVIKYYQWVAIILSFLALCYKMPNIIWKMLHTKSGINMRKVVQICGESPIGEERDANIEKLSHIIDRWLASSKQFQIGKFYKIAETFFCFMFCCGRRTGTYLAGLYLGVKLCYILVSFLLVFLLNKFLAMDYFLYGAEVLSDLANHHEIGESPRFPRLTLCDFEIRQLQNIHRYTVQCVLSVNLYNEKIFAFLWFWFFFMAGCGIYSYVKWLIYLLFPYKRKDYVNKYLEPIISDSQDNKRDSGYIGDERPYAKDRDKFIDTYLCTDGVFALRMLEYNTNEMVVNDLLVHLWSMFKGKKKV